MEEMHIDKTHLNSVTFTNGLSWDEPHHTCEGFTLTTKDGDTITYSIKLGHHQAVADLPYDERQLALFAVMVNYFTDFDPYDRIKSVTWVRDKAPILVDVLGLAGIYPEKFTSVGEDSIREIRWNLRAVLDEYLHVANTTRPINLHITGADMKNVYLGIAVSEAQAANLHSPTRHGFTVKRQGVPTHYIIPKFLHKNVELRLDGVIDVAHMALTVDNLSRLDSKFLIGDIIVDKEANYGRSHSKERLREWVVVQYKEPPVAAGDLHRFLKYQLMSYTVPHPEEGDTVQEPLLVPPSWVVL